MPTAVDNLRLRIGALRPDSTRKELAEIAFSLEYLSLPLANLSEEIFALYLEVLSDPSILSKRGTEGFISGIYNDFHKISGDQRHALLEVLIHNSEKYDDENLRFAVADLIARKYPAEVALNALRRMWSTGGENSRFIARFGADVLALSLPEDDKQKRRQLRKFELEMDA